MSTLTLKRHAWELTVTLSFDNPAEVAAAAEQLKRAADLIQPLPTPEQRGAREASDVAEACAAVLAAVHALPNRPWREVQALAIRRAGKRAMLIDLAREKLIGDRQLEPVERFDENHRKVRGFSYRVVSDKASEAPGEP